MYVLDELYTKEQYGAVVIVFSITQVVIILIAGREGVKNETG